MIQSVIFCIYIYIDYKYTIHSKPLDTVRTLTEQHGSRTTFLPRPQHGVGCKQSVSLCVRSPAHRSRLPIGASGCKKIKHHGIRIEPPTHSQARHLENAPIHNVAPWLALRHMIDAPPFEHQAPETLQAPIRLFWPNSRTALDQGCFDRLGIDKYHNTKSVDSDRDSYQFGVADSQTRAAQQDFFFGVRGYGVHQQRATRYPGQP